jgi:hypothetical protein
VRKVVSQVQSPRHEGFTAPWDGKNDAGEFVSSGVYFCQLVTGGFTQTRKMVLLK